MNTSISPENKRLLEVPYHFPSVSIIMPFEPKISLKNEINYSLETAVEKVKRELEDTYTGGMGELVIQKLKTIIQNLNFNTHKKSIAIYVSPVFEKVLYLDILVKEKIIINEAFEIKDIVYSKKELIKYLLLVLSSKQCSLYLGNKDSLLRIVSNTPESAGALVNDLYERVANYSDNSGRNEILMDKFLLHVDKGLGIILNAYRLPLFVLGTERIVGHFRSISKHGESVVGYVHGNYGESTPWELKEILKPYITNWKKVKKKNLLNQLEEAYSKKELAIGIPEIFREAMHRNGRLLLVENNYKYAAQNGIADDIIFKALETYNKFSCIKDSVDAIIAKVLENGGDVEYVDKDVLENFGHIVLIQYYQNK